MLTHLEERLGRLIQPNVVELGNVLKEIVNIDQRITPYVKEPEQNAYGRNVIYQCEHTEIIVIMLPSHCVTSIHDHGDSIGAGLVVKGRLRNCVFKAQTENLAIEKAEYQFREGQLCFYSRGMIHQIVNSYSDPLILINAYSPPLQNTKVYQLDK
ncbi:cysteine dioxygenase [Paenibacillus agricola]|uniref:Cysteine dioxygenase n=1 Tax=Paenibacillus agricola TaxID=2716264 RepID=A0ABX0J3C1_9BACL|nr:cysteine dioxygenase family protein [Paenibacillus agricola]NHN30153.1 hypothetical protein [Paenibacillus agricola]